MAFSCLGLSWAGLISSAKRCGFCCCLTCTCGGAPVVWKDTIERSARVSNVMAVIIALGGLAGPGPDGFVNAGAEELSAAPAVSEEAADSSSALRGQCEPG